MFGLTHEKQKIISSSFTDTLSLFLKVIRRLRERGEPIRLFGESDEEACQRLRLPFIEFVKYIFVNYDSLR